MRTAATSALLMSVLVAICCSCSSTDDNPSSDGAAGSIDCAPNTNDCAGKTENPPTAGGPPCKPGDGANPNANANANAALPAAGDRVPGLAAIPPPPSTPITATFYVAPNGNDQSDGSINTPWKTIAHANATLTAGQLVLVRAGTYAENIEPANTGTATARIYYRAYVGETVKVTGSDPNVPVLNIHSGKNYITVDGFHIFQSQPIFPGFSGQYVHASLAADHTQVLSCKIVNSRDEVQDYHAGTHDFGMSIYGSHNLVQGTEIKKVWFGIGLEGFNNTIRGNTVESNTMDGIVFGTSYGKLQGHLIESNILGGSHFSDGIQSNGDFDLPDMSNDTSACGVVIRNNIIHDNAENGIDIKGSCKIVIEANIVYGNRGDNDGTYRFDTPEPDRSGGTAIQIGSGTSSTDVIIRNNLVYDNLSGVGMLQNWMIYNNTIVANNRDYEGPNSAFTTTRKPPFAGVYTNGTGPGGGRNNIIADHNSVEVANVRPAGWDHNLYFNSFQTPSFSFTAIPWVGIELSQWKSQTPADATSLVANPQFVNAPSKLTKDTPNLDFRVVAGSPAVNAGTALTTTRAAGNGKQIGVHNAYYFFDGHTAVPGDRIIVGTNQAVTITLVDYDSHTLTVDTQIVWNAEDPVNLPYKGAAPDIGAYEQ